MPFTAEGVIPATLVAFNQDFEIDENTRSPGWLRYQKRIK